MHSLKTGAKEWAILFGRKDWSFYQMVLVHLEIYMQKDEILTLIFTT
jgi:hypothetical protein